MSKVIACPSGLAGEIRTPTGKELKLIASRKLLRSGENFTAVLKSCWLATTAPGPYTGIPEGAPGSAVPWGKVLTGDLLTAFIEIRRLGWGDDYEFSFQCTDKECKTDHPDRTGWSIKLSDLVQRPLTAEMFSAFATGNLVGYDFGGIPVQYRLMTWAGEREASERLKRYDEDDDERLLAALAERLVTVDGRELSVAERARWLEDQEGVAITDFQERLLATDPGPVTGIDVQCRFCKGLIRIDLPFGEDWYKKAKPKVTSPR